MNIQRSVIDEVFLFLAKRTVTVILLFKISYGILCVLLLLAARSAYYHDLWFVMVYKLARQSGEIAVGLYIVTCLPGLGRRLGVRHKLLALVMIFRRQIGILMYMFVLIHVMVLRIVPIVSNGAPLIPDAWFEVFGSIAAGLLFLLFVTSNDVSVKRLGSWWHKIHQLTYITMFFILLHLALQEVSIWTVLVVLLVGAQLISYVVSLKRKK